MKHRLFIALPLSDRLKDTIEAWKQFAGALPVRWISREHLHITLVAPWEADTVDGARAVIERLVTDTPPVDVVFTSVGLGPHPRHPRLIWATGETPQPLAALATTLPLRFGVPVPERLFTLHLTIARFRRTDRGALPHMKEDFVDWHETLTHIALMESLPADGGTRYETIAARPLSQRGAP